MEKAGTLGQKTEAYKFENIDQDAFRAWTEIYEEEFKQFLNIPQLGLTRFYQERMARLADKFNIFQGAMAEFTYLLYLPMEKSFKVMQEKLEQATKEGKFPETSQEYYRIWLRILEGHYMTLFKSPEYTSVLKKTLDATEEFVAARQEVYEDILEMFPVPTNKDMDDLYKELYRLKKRIRDLEKGGRT
jgi:class III poly(R)-hydroxyalkanoic acid synthase PhaE subunit